MPLIMLVVSLLITIWLTHGLVLLPLRLLHLPDFPYWLDWAIILALLSWAIGE